MKRKYLSFLLPLITIVLVASCGPKQYYERTYNGLEYYFFKKNESAKKGDVGDIYVMNISVLNKRDSVIFSEPGRFQRVESVYPGDFHEGLGMLHAGDSVGFILHVDSFFRMHGLNTPIELKDDSTFKLYIGVQEILNPFEHLVFMSEKELKQMKAFVERKQWTTVTDSSGIMYEITEPNPDGAPIEIGDSVLLSYSYTTLNERIVDRTRQDDTYKFQVGSPQSRVSGLSRLLMLMHDGERARAVIPFTEAFGEEGFGVIIPPYTTLVMDVKAEKVK